MRILVAFLLISTIIVSSASASVASTTTGCTCLVHPLIQESENIFGRMTYSAYQHTPVMNDTTGVYLCDCSDYLNTLLKRSRPDAYRELPNYQKSPTTKDYYTLFSTLKTRPSAGSAWYRIQDVRKLCPGDVVVWRNETAGTGHVGLVLSQAAINPSRTSEVLVRIADSTLSPHADDTRAAGDTGIGSGVIGLKIDSKGQAVGMYWRGGVSTMVQPVRVAVGRLVVL